MLTQSQRRQMQQHAEQMLTRYSITLTPQERANIEVADFGLDDFERTGLALVTYINNDRYCAKELIMWPRQTCPEHRHPPTRSELGKMETFRCRAGRVWLYVEGQQSSDIHAHIPPGSEPYYTVFHEVELHPAEQYTIPPDTLHWFQAAEEGAIISEFSSTSHDASDIFTDPRIKRTPIIIED